MARKTDKYIQFQVRLENLKAGEAREIVKLLDNVHQNLINQLESRAHTEWSRERVVAQIESYGKALEQVYENGILPKLNQDGLEFATEALSYHNETLVEQVTGKTFSQRIVNPDDYVEVWRGSLIEEEKSGLWFSESKEFADVFGAKSEPEYHPNIGYYDKSDELIKPNTKKYYLPKEGVYDFGTDKELREEFGEKVILKELNERYVRYNKLVDAGDPLAKYSAVVKVSDGYVPGDYYKNGVKTQKEYITKMLNDYFPKSMEYRPHFEYEEEIIEFLDKHHPDWKITRFDEGGDSIDDIKSQYSYRTKHEGIAKSEYSDFGNSKTTTPAAKAAASQNIGAAVISNNVSPAAIYTAATSNPMQGKLMVEWATQLKRKEIAGISAVLKESWIAGDSVGKAAKNLQPIFARSKRDLTTITRTFYQHLASETQRLVWEENSNLMDGLIWDATLDNRTTLEICAPRDQKKYTLKGEPIGHNLDWHGGPGQAHWNCRSIALPIIKGMKPLIERRAVGAGKDYERGDKFTRTGRVRKNTINARDRGIYKDQNVSTRTNYESWLKRQPKAFQEDVLGVAKAKAFRSGDWKLGEKFTPQNPKTLNNFS